MLLCTQNVHDILAKLLHDMYVHCVCTCDNLVKLLYIQCISCTVMHCAYVLVCVSVWGVGGYTFVCVCVCVCLCVCVCACECVITRRWSTPNTCLLLIFFVQYISPIICMCGIVSLSNHSITLCVVSILHWGFCTICTSHLFTNSLSFVQKQRYLGERLVLLIYREKSEW